MESLVSGAKGLDINEYLVTVTLTASGGGQYCCSDDAHAHGSKALELEEN